MVSICTTKSTFLKTSLTSNTIFQLANEKELFCCRLSSSHIKTKHGRCCL